MATNVRGRSRVGPASALDRAVSLHNAGLLEQAQDAYRALLARDPGNPEVTALLGVARVQAGALDQGIDLLERALKARPDDGIALHNLAVAYDQSDRLDDAERTYARAAAAGVPESWAARGNVLQRQLRWEEAASSFRGSVRHGHADAEVWADLGACLFKAGEVEAAENALRSALALDPAHPVAARNLSAVVRVRGQTDPEAVQRALDALWSHVQDDPDDPFRWNAFCEVFATVRFEGSETAAHVLPIVLACLLRDTVDHQAMARAAHSICKAHPDLGPVVGIGACDVATIDRELRRERVWERLAHPAFRLLLDRAVVPDMSWERLFTRVRRQLALHGDALPDGAGRPAGLLAFAIAAQCFQNGYVWTYGDDEVDAVERLVSEMQDRPLGDDPRDAMRVATLACYVPLSDWDRAVELAGWAQGSEEPSLVALAHQQVFEPAEEHELRELVPTMGELAGEVSARVREMYEENPYPRWRSLGAVHPNTAVQTIRALLPNVSTEALAGRDRPRVLIAGCGTGRQLLQGKQRYRDAELTGVDLSLASLAYACRKAAEAGHSDIRVLQADILSLGDWDERFDIVECCGVLHHMEDPLAGWRVITDLLRPGGLMKIALYSETARRGVVRSRALIADHGWASDPEGIRAARQIIARELEGDPSTPTRWWDFYSMNEARDLLFHVQEHRFTLPGIAAALETLGLEFLGFEALDSVVVKAFEVEHPDAEHTALDAWDAFEQRHPDTFAGMYQFWVRRRG